MATQRLESGQMQLRSVGGVPMVQAQQQQVDFVGPRAAAQGASQLAQVLDRMSASAFATAAPMRQQEGLQFVADNPLTTQQIQLAKDGVPIGIGSTSSLNFFDQAVAKARSLELSGKFEEEGKNVLVKILAEVEAGTITSSEASAKIKSMSDGFSKSLLSQVDPEAAIKFRATMATHGNTVLNSAFKSELKRAKERNEILFVSGYANSITLLQKRFADGSYIDANGVERSVEDFVDMERKNIETKALLLGDVALQKEYLAKFENDVKNAKIDAITSELNQEKYLTDTTSTLAKIRRGDIGKLSPLVIDMLTGQRRDEKSIQQIEKNYLEYVGRNRILREDEQKQKKFASEQQANNLFVEYYTPNTSISRKRDIVNEVAKLNVLSIEQLEKFLDPKAKDGDPFVVANIETRIAFGEITEPEELKRIAARSGLNGKQYQQLNSQLLQGFDKEKSEARRVLRRISGVPDLASSFASKDDEHKINKDRRLNQIWDSKIKEFREANPGKTIPYQRLVAEAENQYNETERKDQSKNEARRKLDNYVRDDLVGKKKVLAGFVIDENTNVEDLVSRGIVPKNDKNDTAGFLQQQINILRQTQR